MPSASVIKLFFALVDAQLQTPHIGYIRARRKALKENHGPAHCGQQSQCERQLSPVSGALVNKTTKQQK